MKILHRIKKLLFGRNSDYTGEDKKGNDMYSLNIVMNFDHIIECVPYVLGAGFGCANAWLFGLEAPYYYLLGGIFAAIGGAFKNYEFDKKPFFRSLLVNAFWVGLVAFLLWRT